MKTNKFLMGALFCALVVGLSGCNGNDPEQNGSNVTKLDKSSGCLNGSFSVAKGKYVRFSMGNLQYTQSTQTWSFAKNQYDMIGEDNVIKVEDEYGYDDYALADKIDLFEWGISILEDYNDYSGDFTDWGQNAISNGGNKANQWRTLTYDEWYYLRYTRANADNLIGVARINLSEDGSEYANGLILLPDNWTAPAGVTFKSGFASAWSVQGYADYQILTLDQWSKLEKAGAVFLPAAGYRDAADEDVRSVGSNGDYWSATLFDEFDAWYLTFYSDEASMNMICCNACRPYRAVRLVQDAK